ncbi:MAG: M48 family metalloprotease, partial [Bradymonadaceae bacterium]
YGASVLIGAALGENPTVIQELVASLAANGAMLKFSRTHEKEADRVGVKYLIRAGYDPRGFISFFERLKGVPRPLSYLTNHPHPQKRIELVRRQIDGRSYDDARVGRDEHQRIVDLLSGNGGD